MRVIATIFFAVACMATICLAKPLTKEELLEMASSGVGDTVILSFIERDCVDFEVTPMVAIELSEVMNEELVEAIVDCSADPSTRSRVKSGGGSPKEVQPITDDSGSSLSDPRISMSLLTEEEPKNFADTIRVNLDFRKRKYKRVYGMWFAISAGAHGEARASKKSDFAAIYHCPDPAGRTRLQCGKAWESKKPTAEDDYTIYAWAFYKERTAYLYLGEYAYAMHYVRLENFDEINVTVEFDKYVNIRYGHPILGSDRVCMLWSSPPEIEKAIKNGRPPSEILLEKYLKDLNYRCRRR